MQRREWTETIVCYIQWDYCEEDEDILVDISTFWKETNFPLSGETRTHVAKEQWLALVWGMALIWEGGPPVRVESTFHNQEVWGSILVPCGERMELNTLPLVAA